ncbi:MAG: DVUA0089 family protein [Planctomycetota bacterium]|nr:DVUA0089 family protein [Planctomycetota bacterium]
MVDVSVQPPVTATFQNGVNGYVGTADVWLQASVPATANGSSTLLGVDGSPLEQTLIQFADLFGNAAGQIPVGATIQSATLRIEITDPGDAPNLYRMRTPWNESATWDSLGAGVQANGVEAETASDGSFVANNGVVSIDVTAALAAWAATPGNNYGWVLLPSGSNGVDMTSSEATTVASRPSLTVPYVSGGTPPTGHAPVAVNDSSTTAEDSAVVIGVLANDSDQDGDPLTPSVVSAPAHGSVVLHADGTITYTPAADFHGADSFTYRVSDGTSFSNTATVAITVSAVNDAPVAVNDAVSTAINTTVVVAVLANDSDVDGDALTPSLVGQPAHGTAVVNANGTISYTPTTGYLGGDLFTYRVSDGALQSNLVSVTLTINNVLSALARFDPVGSQGNANLTGTSAVAGTTVGSLVRVGASYGTNTDVWPVYWYGSTTLDLTQYLSFSVTPDASVQADFAELTVSFQEWVTGTTSVALRTSLDGYAANIGGVQTLADAGSVDAIFDLNSLPLAVGTTTFRIYVFDAVDGTAGWRDIRSSAWNNGKGVLLKGITTPNTAPVANSDSATTNEDVPLSIAVLNNDSDADGQSLTPSIVAQPAHGTAGVQANGTIAYTPAANFHGVDSFTYRVSDGALFSNPAVVSLAVTAVNDAPVASSDLYSIGFGTTLNVPAAGVLANDSDVDGTVLTATLVSGPSHGVLSFHPDGSFQYTPGSGFYGSDSFTYAASDGVLSTQAGATITVAPPVDDHGNLLNSTATPIALSLGSRGHGSSSGVFEIVGDRDVFRVTLDRGTLTVALNGNDNLDTYLRLYNSAGTQIAFDDDSGPGSSSALTVNVSAGTYYISAASYNDSFAGSFSLDVDHRAQITATFQQGVAGYTGASDTFLRGSSPTTSYATAAINEIDYTSASNQEQSLLQFKNLFGSGAGQIPFGSQIVSATLTFYVMNGGNRVNIHRMLKSWSDTATWNSMTGGIQADGIEAVATADAQTPISTLTGWLNMDVKTSIVAWLANPTTNFGWAFLPTGTDGVDLYSVNNTSNWMPRLSIDYLAPNGDQHVNTPGVAATALAAFNNRATAFGTLETAGDRDLFQFTLTQTRTVTINLSAYGTVTAFDSYLRLYNSLGVLIAEDDDSGPGTDSTLTLTLGPGTYFVSVGTYIDISVGDFWLDLLL